MTKKPLPRPNSNNSQVRAYVKAVQKGLKAQHVLPTASGWAVKRAGASKSSGIYGTQKDALKEATRIARNNKTEVYVHGKNGRIRERNSYGSDPYPPKG